MKSLKAIISCLFFAGISFANAGIDEGLRAYQQGDYQTALAEWRPIAVQGDARSQTLVGAMYGTGKGVPQDSTEAVRWYRLAAEQGYAEAQYFLGAKYERGEGVPQDFKAAYAWFSVAAENGFAEAVKARDITAEEFTPEQLAQAQELTKQLFAAKNHPAETQAQRCMVLATIYTSISDTEPMFGEAMTEFGLFFEQVYYAKYLERTGKTMTNGEMNARKEPIFAEFKVSWNKSPQSVAREAAICSAWRSQIAELLTNRDAPTEKTTPKDMAEISGDPPTSATSDQEKRWLDIGELAFAAWKKHGYLTPQKFRELLKN